MMSVDAMGDASGGATQQAPPHVPEQGLLAEGTSQKQASLSEDIFGSGKSGGVGKSRWLHKCRDFLWRLDFTWTCRETRNITLGGETLQKMKNTFWLSRIVFLRLLALVYFFAFLSAFNQNQGLLGSDGISPASDVIADLKKRFADLRGWDRVKAFPSFFLLFPPSDFWLGAIPFLGMVTSVGVFITGAANAGFMLLLWLLQHSLFSIGQQWYFFGWESQLLETGFLAIWLCPFWSCSRFPLSWPTPKVCVWGSRWLVFRVLLGKGLYMLRNEGLWRNLTALNYQFETQPLPTPLSWYFHQQSAWLHVAEAVVCLVMSCVIPFIILIPLRPFRLFGGISVIIFELVSALTGNVSFSNLLTIVPAVMCIDDRFLASLFPVRTLARMTKATSGCAGRWSCPHMQGWPLDHAAHHKETPEADSESQRLLSGDDGKLEANEYSNPLTKPRSCFCWYWPDIVDFLKRNRMPRGTVDSAVRHIRQRWWKIFCEVAIAAAIIACEMRLSTSATYAVWEVIGVFFLVLLQAAFSAFVSRTKASYIFTEIILSFATIVSFFNLFLNGPEVWSVWLLSCLIAVLSIYAYSTLRNAALVTKVHVELLLLSLIVVLSIPVVQNLLAPQQIPNANFEPFQIVNSYGPVSAVQKERYELVVQGTDETQLGANTNWKNYEFACKPTNLWRRPCFAAPYHHRLDWLMTMLSAEDKSKAMEHHKWLSRFLQELLKNNASVTSLLRHNPFAGKEPPAHIRVLRAHFRFSSSEDHGLFSSGPWWEISKGTTQVYIEPQEVPGAQEHLQKLIEERTRRRKEEELRLKAEEERRRKAEEAVELQRRLEAAREAALKAKKRHEENERLRREAQMRRKEAEEQARKEEMEKAESQKKKAQEEAEAKKKREEEEAAAKAAEAKAKKEAALRQKEQEEAEMQKQKEAKEKAEKDARDRELERQRLEAEKLKKEEALRAEREAQREREEEAMKHKREAEEAMQRQEEERRRGEEETRLREVTKEKHEEQSTQQAQEPRFFVGVRNHAIGGVPLREAPRLSKKKSHLRKRR